jgi:hypothetical protein
MSGLFRELFDLISTLDTTKNFLLTLDQAVKSCPDNSQLGSDPEHSADMTAS